MKSPFFLRGIFRTFPPTLVDQYIQSPVKVDVSDAETMGILVRSGNAFFLADDVSFPFRIPFFRRCFKPEDMFTLRVVADDVFPAVAIDIYMSGTFVPLVIMDQVFGPVTAFVLGIFMPCHFSSRPIYADQINPAILIDVHRKIEEGI